MGKVWVSLLVLALAAAGMNGQAFHLLQLTPSGKEVSCPHQPLPKLKTREGKKKRSVSLFSATVFGDMQPQIPDRD